MPLSACPKLAEAVHYLSCVGAFRLTSCRERQSEGEGACLLFLADRSHLPLRGKLGWMTPRAGVKTTPATETRLTGPPDPKRGPHFFLVLCQAYFRYLPLLTVVQIKQRFYW